jgi:hypothetical protein
MKDMTDKEIFDSINTIVGSHVSALTMLISTETQDIRHSVDQLTERVKRQNGSVRDLNEWKASVIGEDKGADKLNKEKRANFQKVLQLIATVVMAIGLCITTYFSIFGSKQSKKNSEEIGIANKKIDDFGTPVIVDKTGKPIDSRSVELKMWPKDFINDTLKSE